MNQNTRPVRVVVGRVIRTHGVRGEIRVRGISDLPGRLQELKTLWLTRAGNEIGQFTVRQARPLQDDTGLKLSGIDTREQADLLKGSDVEAEALSASSLPDKTYFVFDLVGMTVRTEEDEILGLVTDVDHYPANDVLTIRNDERQYSVPMIRDVICNVDLDQKTITVRMLPGLADL